MISCSGLTEKKRRLLFQSLADFDARWDESVSLLRSEEDGELRHATRASVFYALALLIRQNPGDAERADRIIRKVISLQRLGPGQIWHGTFANAEEQPFPVRSGFDISHLTPEARWQGDVLWGQLSEAFRSRLQNSSPLRGFASRIEDTLSASLRDVFPVVWQTYDPNWREFVLAAFALILEEYDGLLPPDTVCAMEQAAREGLSGARFRAESGLTPLNTNVEVMHVFIFDAFARRFGDSVLAEYAADYASRFTEEYLRLHAVAEFNSPTYNGVVLSYTSLLRDRGGSPEVRNMGKTLDEGLWEDFADFYNPAMHELCGPYSRAYGLEISQTALPMLMYLGMDEIPEDRVPAFCGETESACIICFSDVRIPERVVSRLLTSCGERRITRSFRELAERGEPGRNHSLCTVTAWISDRLMLGAIRGSTNTSHQLHSAVAHWKNPSGGISALRLRRRTADGRLVHLRTVLFDLTAAPEELSGTVRNRTGETVICNFEIESPDAAKGNYQKDLWQVDGLRCKPAFMIESPDLQRRETEGIAEVKGEGVVWVNVPLKPEETLHLSLCFSPEPAADCGK